MLLADDESEFNYNEESDKGPQNWGNIKPEWFMCKNGTKQSPIDILNQKVQIVSNLGTLQINYKPSNATLKNRGHDIMVINQNHLIINKLSKVTFSIFVCGYKQF